jgi:hypothetical protein
VVNLQTRHCVFLNMNITTDHQSLFYSHQLQLVPKKSHVTRSAVWFTTWTGILSDENTETRGSMT